jgi:hypothetical protein
MLFIQRWTKTQVDALVDAKDAKPTTMQRALDALGAC